MAQAPYDYLHKRQSGGRGQYGKVIGYFEPIDLEDEQADGIEFISRLSGNEIPKNSKLLPRLLRQLSARSCVNKR